jgi:hypothetical protein
VASTRHCRRNLGESRLFLATTATMSRFRVCFPVEFPNSRGTPRGGAESAGFALRENVAQSAEKRMPRSNCAGGRQGGDVDQGGGAPGDPSRTRCRLRARQLHARRAHFIKSGDALPTQPRRVADFDPTPCCNPAHCRRCSRLDSSPPKQWTPSSRRPRATGLPRAAGIRKPWMYTCRGEHDSITPVRLDLRRRASRVDCTDARGSCCCPGLETSAT